MCLCWKYNRTGNKQQTLSHPLGPEMTSTSASGAKSDRPAEILRRDENYTRDSWWTAQLFISSRESLMVSPGKVCKFMTKLAGGEGEILTKIHQSSPHLITGSPPNWLQPTLSSSIIKPRLLYLYLPDHHTTHFGFLDTLFAT